jgi:hypothetical protein
MTIRSVAWGLFALIVVGLMADLLSGFPLSRGSRSWATWLLGILACGALYAVAEVGGGWILARDSVTDPLPKRAWHVALLVGFAVFVCLLFVTVLRLAT